MTLSVNGQAVDLPPECTVRELLERCGLATAVCAVEVNTCLVPKSEHADHRLAEGDHVEVVTLVGGG